MEVNHERLSISKSELILLATEEEAKTKRRPVATTVVDLRMDTLDKPHIVIKLAQNHWEEIRDMAEMEIAKWEWEANLDNIEIVTLAQGTRYQCSRCTSYVAIYSTQ